MALNSSRSSDDKDASKDKGGSDINFNSLVKGSDNFQSLKRELQIATKLSLTGITNLVINHEDPCLVDAFLKECFKMQELYNNTIDIDAVELQMGQPGKMRSYGYLDELIYGTIETEDDPDLGIPVPKVDPQTGKRKRKADGFVTRRDVLLGKFKDKLLIIKNMDFCMDFCFKDKPGVMEPKALNILDNFRNPTVRKGCRLLLISNLPLKLPFQVRTVSINAVDEHEANHIIDSFINLYTNAKYHVNFTKTQRDQIVRKLVGLTYTEAGDVLASSLSSSENPPDSKQIDSIKTLKTLRKAINKKFMEKGFGLTQLTPRPWEDYICPESSNFTWDVKKLLRDFNEISDLRAKSLDAVAKGKDESKYEDVIERIQTRMPHVMVLYGKGGVGKCLGEGTRVRMFDGSLKNVEDVKKGDALMGPDSGPRTVLTTTAGVGPLYKVTQKNGMDYICNNKHILSLKNEGRFNDEPVFISAEDHVKKNKTWRKTHYGWKIGVEFDKKDLPIDPYWFGLWLGDGTSMKPAITVGDQDNSTKQWLMDWARANDLFVRIEKNSTRKAVCINFAAREGSGYANNFVKKALRDMNVLGNKHIPSQYLINNRANRLKLLAGLIDSDGYKCKSGSLQFFNTNEKLARDVADLGRSLGFKVFESSSIKKLKSHNYEVECFSVVLGGNLSEILTLLKRKQGHNNPQKIGVKYGIEVDPIGNGKYYGFTIDGDHQFLLEDYTVTHNSAFPIHLAGLLGFDIWDFNVNSVHSKWVGQGSEQARKSIQSIMNSSHAIIRIDEYDRAIGATNDSAEGMHEAHKQVESEFMAWLQNGQEENEFMKRDIFVVLTTNHKDTITGPMLRSGRVDLVIDIDNFDSESMKETLQTTGRRMKNRGVKVLGYATHERLQEAINELDLTRISELCTMKGFTVRDVETLIMEMAAYYYYFRRGDKDNGLDWTTDNFVEVLNYSEGSMKEDDSTGELILGDRELFQRRNRKSDSKQGELNFDVKEDVKEPGFKECK
ncbi:MAG: Hint domain-containing homing endonuclease [Synergistaceae bacterium]